MMVASNICEKKKVELSILPGGLSENRGNANVRVICCFLERWSPKHGFGDALGARSETARVEGLRSAPSHPKIEHALPN